MNGRELWRRLGPAVFLAIGIAAFGCGDDDRPGPTDSGRDAPRTDTGHDGGSETCTSDGECDDGLPCTLDGCGVSGVCSHEALSERCGEAQICSPMRGCIDGCTTDADCQNDSFCDGPERCVADQCFGPLRPVDCDDGNECTTDTCDEDVRGCVYDGCDGGVVSPDAGRPPDFDPAVHYAGEFLVAPAPSLGCPPASYAVGSVTFSRAGGDLRVMADRFLLTQSPAPTDGNFRVTGTDGSCSNVSFEGSFDNADQFMANWSASCGAICGNQMRAVFGERND